MYVHPLFLTSIDIMSANYKYNCLKSENKLQKQIKMLITDEIKHTKKLKLF